MIKNLNFGVALTKNYMHPFSMKKTRIHPADLHAAREIARAAYFTVFRCDIRQRTEYASLSEARAAAGEHPRALIYAVTPENLTHHVPKNYQPS
jgi:hypothetical protein